MEEINKITDYIIALRECCKDRTSDWISEDVRTKEILAISGLLGLKTGNTKTEDLRLIAQKLMGANDKQRQNTLSAIVTCNKAIRETDGEYQRTIERRLRKLKLIDYRQEILNSEILNILQNAEDKTKFQRLEKKELEEKREEDKKEQEKNNSTEPKGDEIKEYGEWLTAKEISEYFKLSYRNVNSPKWRKGNGIPFKQPGGYGCQVTFSKTEVEKWMKETKRR